MHKNTFKDECKNLNSETHNRNLVLVSKASRVHNSVKRLNQIENLTVKFDR